MGFGSALKGYLYESKPGEKSPQVLLSTLRAKTLGVDLNVVLHSAMFSSFTTPVISDESDVVEIQRGDVAKYLSRWYRQHNFVELGIRLIFVMDGMKDEDKESNVREKRSERFMSEREIRRLRRSIGSTESISKEDFKRMRHSVRLTTRMVVEAVNWIRCHNAHFVRVEIRGREWRKSNSRF